jgi:phytoene dehydrogenase-like protein
VSVLNRQPREIGHNQTIVFYNDSDNFEWRVPQDEMCDLRTGVICSPNNFAYAGDGEGLPDGVIRVTSIASYDRWKALDESQYRLEKLRWYDRATASAVRFMPDFRPYVIDTDMFSPTTIHRFTWHDNGAVYGAPEKRIEGTTHLKNLFLCGTDQGYVGIIGAIMSGIAMANRHCLSE